MIDVTDVNVFAIAAFAPGADTPCGRQPLLATLLAQVAFDEEEVFAEVIEVYRRVVAAVQPQQAAPVQAQCSQSLDTSANELRCAALAMLTSGPQLAVQHVPFGAQIGKDRRIAVVLLVGERNALFR